MIITKKLKNGIVSEKYYTLAEKEAFKELLQKTNGLTKTELKDVGQF